MGARRRIRGSSGGTYEDDVDVNRGGEEVRHVQWHSIAKEGITMSA